MFDCYRGKKVLVTGHTGFKGSWLCEWLLSLGAEVHGLALPPPTRPSLFSQLRLGKRIATDIRGDIRDLATVKGAMRRVKPDFVFHLAAQPLVRLSYKKPVETFDTNVMGTVNVLEAVRAMMSELRSGKPVSVVCVTTDKVYENDDSGKAFREGFCDKEAIASRYEAIVSIEEHNVMGGLGSIIADHLLALNLPAMPKLVKLGLQDVYTSIVGSQSYLRKYYGLTPEDIVRVVRGLIR